MFPNIFLRVRVDYSKNYPKTPQIPPHAYLARPIGISQDKSAVEMKNKKVAYLRGNIRSPLSIPGVQDRKQAKAVSKTIPKFRAQFLMPWWTIELRLVLQTIKSAHWTITMETKNAVWHVYSKVFRSLQVYNGENFQLTLKISTSRNQNFQYNQKPKHCK